ncbi:DUF2778 domain-containing protein [Xanthobacter pseudotagetidis]|uniref:DUF2778 domain-containing protein n=1 Tax=Xanthobacter pseudotagetidis TaxID=3119911 RepID=UPI00372B714A
MTAYDFDWDDESGYDLYDESREDAYGEPRRRAPMALLVGAGVVLAGLVGGGVWFAMAPGGKQDRQAVAIAPPAPPVVLRTHSGPRPGADGGIPSAGTLSQGEDWMFAPGVVTGARGFASSAEAPSTNIVTSNTSPAPLPPSNPGRQAGVSAPLPTPNPLSRERDAYPMARERDTYGELAQRDADKDHLPWVKADVALPTAGSGYALYDIVGQTVYMPNGDRLEAHSGYGKMFDDPRHVSKRMVGPTPPNTYNLAMREALFHGVEAIRMHPVDKDKMFGRDGILSHTYLLGPRGDSNGCVSFKDYDKFLAAFKRGEIKQMIVVAELANPPPPANPLLAWLSGNKR